MSDRLSNTGRDDLTARLLRHRTAELEEYKRAALSRDMSPEFVAEFESLKQQLAGVVDALQTIALFNMRESVATGKPSAEARIARETLERLGIPLGGQ